QDVAHPFYKPWLSDGGKFCPFATFDAVVLTEVHDTRINEEADRNKIVLKVLKQADHLEAAPFGDEEEVEQREATLALARRLMAEHYHGRRKELSPRRRGAPAGQARPARRHRRLLAEILATVPEIDEEAQAPEAGAAPVEAPAVATQVEVPAIATQV